MAIGVFLISTNAAASIAEPEHAHYAHDFCPHTIVDNFLQAVDRGELLLFGEVITRDMFRPVRVEYVHDLVSGTATFKVYVELLEPKRMTSPAEFIVTGISAIIDGSGHIVDATAHAMAK